MFRVGDPVRLNAKAEDPLLWEREGTVERVAPDGAVLVAWPHQGRLRYTYREPEELAHAAEPGARP